MSLLDMVTAWRPTAVADVARYYQAPNAVAQLGNARRARLNQATDGVPGLPWVALVAAALVTIGFAFVFRMPSLLTHMAVVFSITPLVGALVLVVDELSPPFSHAVHIEPTAFELAIARMGSIT